MKKCPPELLEKLADLEHERWSGWIKHQFKKGRFDHDGTSWIMPPWAVVRWMRQSLTPYAELDEKTKESDRVEVRKTWAIIAEALELDEKRRAALEKMYHFFSLHVKRHRFDDGPGLVWDTKGERILIEICKKIDALAPAQEEK